MASEALERIVHCPENLYQKTLLCECVLAYLPTDDEQRLQFEAMVRNHPDPGVRSMELGFLDHVEQRGLEKGMRQWIEQGLLEGQRQIVRELLETRFGPLAPAALAKLALSVDGSNLAELKMTEHTRHSISLAGRQAKLLTAIRLSGIGIDLCWKALRLTDASGYCRRGDWRCDRSKVKKFLWACHWTRRAPSRKTRESKGRMAELADAQDLKSCGG